MVALIFSAPKKIFR